MIIIIISILFLLYAVLNSALNGRTIYFEIFTIIPTSVVDAVIFIMLILSLFTGNFIALILFIISLLLLLPFSDISIEKTYSQEKPNLKILDWNTLYFYPENSPKLCKYIESFNADIVVLQELTVAKDINSVSNQKKSIPLKLTTGLKYLDKNYILSCLPTYKNIIKSYDLGVISNFSLEKIKDYSANEIFGYLIVKVIHPEYGDIYIINVHMPFQFNYNFGYKERKTTFESLYKDITEMKNLNKKVILTGDFNSTKNSRFIQNIFKVLHESISERNSGLNISWHPVLKFWRMDFMFYSHSPNLKCIKSNFFNPKQFSDHKGIISEFAIRNTKK